MPYFITQHLYNIYSPTSQNKAKLNQNTRRIIEFGRTNIIKSRLYANLEAIAPSSEGLNLTAINIFGQLKERLKADEDIKNWGVEIVSLDLKQSNKPISNVVIQDPPNSGKYKLIATLLWFEVVIKYKTKDQRILTLKTELPLINNIDSYGVENDISTYFDGRWLTK